MDRGDGGLGGCSWRMNRRDLIASVGTLAATAAMSRLERGVPLPELQGAGFPRKADFNVLPGQTYLNGAFVHPMPKASAAAYKAAIDRRATIGTTDPFVYLNPSPDTVPRPVNPREAFAALINAKPNEIAYIPNTSTGENIVVEALGITKFDGNVVTDALHFEGALVHLMELQKQGLDLRVVPQREGRIDLNDLERVVDSKTKLIEVSLVAMYNGFQHDLKAICDLAHAHGAYVYADIVQGVGAVPFDVRTTGVDFAAAATYKWLMGDFGLGFLYVREDLLGSVVKRTHWSYESAPDTELHLAPGDPQLATPVTWSPGDTANSHFQLGTMANGVAAALRVSLPYIQRLGVGNIQAWRQPMLQKLQSELPRLGFPALTPPESTSPIVSFAHNDPAGLRRKLRAGKVSISVNDHYLRIAPSVYNDLHDVERLLEALA